MAASHERAQRGADPRDMSLVSISACSGSRIIRAERSRLRPHIGLSRAFKRP